ncbi:type II toxin-antitoxin system VapC family toxin [Azospirillum sp. sgz301742]
MRLVVDASVAVLWFLGEPLSDRAAELPKHHDLSAPDFMAVELANVLWKRLQRDPNARPGDTGVFAAIRQVPVRWSATMPLIATAGHIAAELRHPVYDCLYLAVAEAQDATVVTLDQRFLKTATGTRFESRMVHLSQLA